MTNNMILFQEKQRLLNEGILKGTGRTITAELPDGTKMEVPEVEEIHTYAKWKQLGRQVKRGQKAIAEISIWKHTTKQVEITADMEQMGDDGKRENMFLKKAYWFTIEQTEPMAAKA